MIIEVNHFQWEGEITIPDVEDYTSAMENEWAGYAKEMTERLGIDKATTTHELKLVGYYATLRFLKAHDGWRIGADLDKLIEEAEAQNTKAVYVHFLFKHWTEGLTQYVYSFPE